VKNTIDFYDIYDYIYIPFWKTKIFITIVTILLFSAIAVASYFFYKKRKQKKLSQKPPLSPKEWALEELEKLNPEKYNTKQEFKDFYFSLTRIYKTFLYKKFSWQVAEKTDEELLEFLRNTDLGSSTIEKLEKILNGSLLIKFADAQALKEQAQVDLTSLISIL
jgi:hypothetical protein